MKRRDNLIRIRSCIRRCFCLCKAHPDNAGHALAGLGCQLQSDLNKIILQQAQPSCVIPLKIEQNFCGGVERDMLLSSAHKTECPWVNGLASVKGRATHRRGRRANRLGNGFQPEAALPKPIYRISWRTQEIPDISQFFSIEVVPGRLLRIWHLFQRRGGIAPFHLTAVGTNNGPAILPNDRYQECLPAQILVIASI